ncbi:MAG: hydrolase [Planctomycetes bacterium]|nr:hydrolase [Planctomycetota bacterium]
MNDTPAYARSPELMTPEDTVLVVVDVQEKLMPLIAAGRRIIWNLRRLLDGAEATGLKVLATEQYPQGLGPTVHELASRLGEIPSKTAFSCLGCEPFAERLGQSGASKVMVAGIEAHVCVQQTALDLRTMDYDVFVCADAVGSRGRIDYEYALHRMRQAGVLVTTVESVLFELCNRCDTDRFKGMLEVIKAHSPAD